VVLADELTFPAGATGTHDVIHEPWRTPRSCSWSRTAPRRAPRT